MIVVHGLVTAAGSIAVWAERARTVGDTGSRGAAPPHPYAVAPPLAGVPGSATVTLPSAGSSPLPSPELADPRTVRGRRQPRRWTVPTVTLPAGSDPEALVEADPEARGGASLGWLADVVAFAADLVDRGRVLPAVLDGPAARWRAVLTGVDVAHAEDLRRAAPGVVLAATGVGPAEAVRHLLDTEVDARVRARLGRPLRPAGPETSTVDAWLAGLTGPPGTFSAAPADVVALRDRLELWRASLQPGAVRVCFRLSHVEEGDTDDEPAGWLLEFLLQAVADPSVLVPAGQIWSERTSALFAWVDDPPEALLAGLGRAARLYPDLDTALYDARPEALALDVEGAYRFLRHAPLLTEAGFGVLVPAAWQRPAELGLTFTVHSGAPAAPVLRDRTANLAAIVDYRWGLALGGVFLSEADLTELARAKVPLVRLRGRWVFLDRRQLEAGLAFLARGGSGQMTAGEALRHVRLFPDEERALPVTDVAGSGWVADLLAGRLSEELVLVDPPASLATTLRPYQLRGLSWLAFLGDLGIGALLADDMGLGKTVQLLALEARDRAAGPRPPTLVVCPLSVLGNWRREIARFTPELTVRIHHGAGRGRPEPADLVLTTYQVAVRDIDELAATAWDRVVLDEAQLVKNSTAVTARAVRRLTARHRVALTGTPVENRLTELWSIMDFLNPGVLGSASRFRARYSVPVERYADSGAAGRLRQVIRPFTLRRLKTDPAVIADLPDKRERTQWCNLTPEQATLYRAVVDELFAKLAEGRDHGIQRKGLVLAAMTKLKQACNHPAQLLGDGSAVAGRSGKLARLEELLAGVVADGDRALVFTQYVRFGALLAPYLGPLLGVPVEFLHGGVSRAGRDAMVERFQTGTGPGVLLLSVRAGGTGLNLTAATHVIHLDRWWNPATEAQATDRAYRIGQRRDVEVHTFVCIGTVEERIDALIAEKRTMAQLALGTGEGWLTTLSTEDLRELVMLRGPDE